MAVERPNTEHIAELLAMLDGDDLDERLTAIHALGEIGDETALRLLRERLSAMNKAGLTHRPLHAGDSSPQRHRDTKKHKENKGISS